MGRKVFHDFANVLCRKFVETPSNLDLINLFILGSGQIELDILGDRATCNRAGIEPFPFCHNASAWLKARLDKLGIPHTELVKATLSVAFESIVDRSGGMPQFPSVKFKMTCVSAVSSADRTYEGRLDAETTWGILTIGRRHLLAELGLLQPTEN